MNISTAIRTAETLLDNAPAIVIAWSGGKDSSTVASIVLAAAARKVWKSGEAPEIIITHADTGVENPAMETLARSEMKRIAAYADRNGLNVRIEIATPSLNATWAVRVIGGRALPVFAGKGHRDCSVDWKVKPQQRIYKKLRKECRAKYGVAPVTIVGNRYAESTTRSARMTARGESATSVWTDADGSLKLSLIADWSDEDVWRYILDCHTSLRASYSDFSGVLSLYKCGSGASEHPLSPLDGKIPSRCRFGCALCTVGRDESMANMLRLDPQKYGYMAGLHQLQQFLLATQHDWSRRQWVGRSLCNGYVAIGPDVYSPAMLEEILRYALSLDACEKEAAATAGIAPRFELVSSQALIAIDAMWSLHGYHRPFHALKIFRDIYIYGHRWDIPTITAVPKKARPAARYLYVGENWDEGHSWAYTGLREPFLESGDSPCAATKVLRNGHEIIDVQTSPAFEINEEAAEFLLHYELDRLIEEYHDDSMYSTTAGYRFYAQLGAISFAQSGQPALIDTTLRRTSFKERHGLVGQLSAHRLSNLLARTIAAPVGPTPRQGILSVYRRAEMALAS